MGGCIACQGATCIAGLGRECEEMGGGGAQGPTLSISSSRAGSLAAAPLSSSSCFMARTRALKLLPLWISMRLRVCACDPWKRVHGVHLWRENNCGMRAFLSKPQVGQRPPEKEYNWQHCTGWGAAAAGAPVT